MQYGSSAPAAHPGSGGRLAVVLVEDHEDYREQLRQLLESMDDVEVVHMAACEASAIAWLRDHPEGWDLLVLDIFLAAGHGFRVLRACAARRDGQRIAFLTSYTREPAREQALALGADALFDKVGDLGDFMRFVSRCQADLVAAA